MFSLKISNADMSFDKATLMWKSYITNKALPTTKQVKIIDPKKFVIVLLDMDNKIFVAHVTLQK